MLRHYYIFTENVNITCDALSRFFPSNQKLNQAKCKKHKGIKYNHEKNNQTSFRKNRAVFVHKFSDVIYESV